jgi:hypothetical protein
VNSVLLQEKSVSMSKISRALHRFYTYFLHRLGVNNFIDPPKTWVVTLHLLNAILQSRKRLVVKISPHLDHISVLALLFEPILLQHLAHPVTRPKREIGNLARLLAAKVGLAVGVRLAGVGGQLTAVAARGARAERARLVDDDTERRAVADTVQQGLGDARAGDARSDDSDVGLVWEVSRLRLG